MLGIRDYFRKQDLPPGAVVGLSGGIDSAVTAWLAVEALGARARGRASRCRARSRRSTASSDALALGRKLGIAVRRLDIRPIYEAYLGAFRALFGARETTGSRSRTSSRASAARS